MEKIRLDKYLSSQVNISRSEAKTAVRRGKISVNNVFVKDPAVIIIPETDEVKYDGQAIIYKKYIYILMNKPAGILSASNDKNRKTVVDLVPDRFKRAGLFPVGRLDKDTTGLLIITDDGNFAHKVISPKSNIEKCYIAGLDGEVTEDMVEKFAKGIVLQDGTLCKPAKLERLDNNKAKITITEGKYHQIKRMFGVVGLGVNSLHRESIGHISVPENLPFGECVEILLKDVENLCL